MTADPDVRPVHRFTKTTRFISSCLPLLAAIADAAWLFNSEGHGEILMAIAIIGALISFIAMLLILFRKWPLFLSMLCFGFLANGALALFLAGIRNAYTR